MWRKSVNAVLTRKGLSRFAPCPQVGLHLTRRVWRKSAHWLILDGEWLTGSTSPDGEAIDQAGEFRPLVGPGRKSAVEQPPLRYSTARHWGRSRRPSEQPFEERRSGRKRRSRGKRVVAGKVDACRQIAVRPAVAWLCVRDHAFQIL